MTALLHVPLEHSLNQVYEGLRTKMRRAQDSVLDREFVSSQDLFRRVTSELRVDLAAPPGLADAPPSELADGSINELTHLFFNVGREAGVPWASLPLLARNAAERVQLVAAFADPDAIVRQVEGKVKEAVEAFPRTAEDIECGSNPGDVLDPYILAATQELMYAGSFESAIGATVAHKALMMIEDLLGHLHGDVIGAMRGNVRVPEPRGNDQETLSYTSNPFPGADVVQPPLTDGELVRFHQIKSKTGSATGGGAGALALSCTSWRRCTEVRSTSTRWWATRCAGTGPGAELRTRLRARFSWWEVPRSGP